MDRRQAIKAAVAAVIASKLNETKTTAPRTYRVNSKINSGRVTFVYVQDEWEYLDPWKTKG